MTNLSGVVPVNAPRPAKQEEVTPLRQTVVERRTIDGPLPTVPDIGALAVDLPNVFRSEVDMQIARGSRFHEDNTEQLTVMELKDKYNEIRDNPVQKPQPPTTTQIFGDTVPVRPSDFHKDKAVDQNDLMVINEYTVNGKRHDMGDLAKGILNNCVMGGRYRKERLETYREYFGAMLGFIDAIEKQAKGLPAQQLKYNVWQAQLEDAASVAKKQYSFDLHLTPEDVQIVETKKEEQSRVDELERQLAEAQKSQESIINRAVDAALKKAGVRKDD